MRISISQIYVKPNINFPFSSRMQRWLSDEITSVVSTTNEFTNKFGEEFNLKIRISADDEIVDNKIMGPTIFKKDKDVEYTLFLPYRIISESSEGCRVALEFILSGIHVIFQKVGIDTEKLVVKFPNIVEVVCSDSTMLKKPWPEIKRY